MIKGCQKKIIHIKDTKSTIFAEAYLVLKPCAEQLASERDIIAEANEIINGAQQIRNNGEHKKHRGRLVPFFLGGIFTVGILLLAHII